MELRPRAFVAAGSIPFDEPPPPTLSHEWINDVWNQLAPAHGFRQLEIAPDDTYARLYTDSQADGLLLYPTAFQVSRVALEGGTFDNGPVAGETEALLTSLVATLEADTFAEIALRQVYYATVSDQVGAARDLMLRQIPALTDADLTSDAPNATTPSWPSIRLVLPREDSHWTVAVEPLVADEMRSLYVELDARYAGEGGPESVAARANDTRDHMEKVVSGYIERLVGASPTSNGDAETAG